MCLEFTSARLGYGREPVLDGVSFTVAAGEAVALLGGNGAGKSTVLKAPVGLSQVLGGTVTTGGSPGTGAAEIGYVPQHADIAPEFPITAQEVVGLGLVPRLKPFRRIGREGWQRCRRALDVVGLEPLARRRFDSLSGGQRQRVLLARAIVSGPQVLLLDEPFNGLDAPSRALLIQLVREFKAKGMAVLLSTHDLELSERACDRALTVSEGKVAP